MSKCWSLETNLRPKFSVLKDILSEVFFECFLPNKSEIVISSQLISWLPFSEKIIFSNFMEMPYDFCYAVSYYTDHMFCLTNKMIDKRTIIIKKFILSIFRLCLR